MCVRFDRMRLLVALMILASVGSTATAARGEEAPGPNSGRVSLSVNNEVTTAYMFRGILQERGSLIWEPSGSLGLNLYSDDEGFLSSVDLGFGVWASYHDKETGATGNGPDPLYEVDYYPSLGVTLGQRFSTGATYYLYTSPNGAFRTVQELSWTMAFDDSGLISDNFSLQPTTEMAFEMNNTSFGNGKGIYAGVGLEPNTTLRGDTNYPVTFKLPLKVGLSADEYYYAPEDGYTDNETFGFFSFGFKMEVGLGIVPKDFGSWTFGAGVTCYVLGDNLEEVNHGDSPFPVGTVGLAMSY